MLNYSSSNQEVQLAATFQKQHEETITFNTKGKKELSRYTANEQSEDMLVIRINIPLLKNTIFTYFKNRKCMRRKMQSNCEIKDSFEIILKVNILMKG